MWCPVPPRPRGLDGPAYGGRMIIVAAIAADSTQLVGLGRAPRVAVATVEGDEVVDMTILDVQWDVLHGDGCGHDHDTHDHGHTADETAVKHAHGHAGGGSHHARIVTFLREHHADAVLAAHAGPPMVHTIQKMGLVFLAAQGDAQDVLVAAAGVVARG